MRIIIVLCFISTLCGCADFEVNPNARGGVYHDYIGDYNKPQKKIDSQCMTDCQNANYSQQFCESKCSY